MASRKLHTNARTTRRQRRLIQGSQDTDRACAERMKINVKTVAKWRRRDSVEDLPMGPKALAVETISPSAEVLIAAVRQLTWASLDVLLPRLQTLMPFLSRSAIYRIWRKWGVSRTPRTPSPPDFAFMHRSRERISSSEPYQIRAFLLPTAGGEPPRSERGGPLDGQSTACEAIIFAVGESSGRIFAMSTTEFEAGQAYKFLKHIQQTLRMRGVLTPITQVTTPFNQAFCDEQFPYSWGHRFCLFCKRNNIQRRLATLEPTPITVFEKGWPGFAAKRKVRVTRRRHGETG